MVDNRNLITLTGRIGEIRFGQNRCRFTLQVDNSYFVIEAPGREQVTVCRAVGSGNGVVYVIARPRSYVHRRCRQHHVYFEAIAVIPLDKTGELQALLSVLTEELYRNRNGKDEADGHGGGGLPESEY